MGKLFELWECADSSVSISIEIRSAKLEYDVYLVYSVCVLCILCFVCSPNFKSYVVLLLYCKGIERTFHFCLSVSGVCDNRIFWHPFISNFPILLRHTPNTRNQAYRSNILISYPTFDSKYRSKCEIKCIPRFLGLVCFVYSSIRLLSRNLMFVNWLINCINIFSMFVRIERWGNIGFLANNSNDQI